MSTRVIRVAPRRPDDVAAEAAVPGVGDLVNPVDVVGSTRPLLPQEAHG